MAKRLDRPIMDRLKDAFKKNQLVILEDFRVAEWSPGTAAANRAGRDLPPTEIHIVALGRSGEMIVVRLRSFRVVQELIDALDNHKRTVFPEQSKAHDAGFRQDGQP